MNIFILDHCPTRAAQALTDKHVVKMCLETAQILCTVHHEILGDAPYRPTHKNHPCVRWASSSGGNYYWTLLHGIAIGQEYTRRYGKQHKSARVIGSLPTIPRHKFEIAGRTPFVLAMPEQYQCGDAVSAYRNYYRSEKASQGWHKGSPPNWL